MRSLGIAGFLGAIPGVKQWVKINTLFTFVSPESSSGKLPKSNNIFPHVN
jgi:hypothetical protein